MMNLRLGSLRDLWKRRKPKDVEDEGFDEGLDEGLEARPEEGVARGGRLYALWLVVLPVLLGLSLGWLASVCLGVFLDRFDNPSLRRQSAPAGGAVQEKAGGAGLEVFLAANPFRVSPMPAPVLEDEQQAEPEPEVISYLDESELRGTLPGVGAWLTDNGNLRLIRVGTSFDLYTLEQVTYREAVFVRSGDVVVKDMVYGPVAARPPRPRPEPPKPAAPKPAAEARPAEVPVGEVVAAKAGEREGEIPSGLVNQLVQNPFDELKKVRLRPKGGEAGLEIQWIQKDSILSRLGVQKGDVIKGINGIPFTNMADIANSINSLMSSERFDVEVSRKGETTSLRYVVR